MSEFLKGLFLMFFWGAVVFLIISIPVRIVESIDCYVYGKQTNKNVEMELLKCYVEHDNNWYTQPEYKALITAKAGLE